MFTKKTFFYVELLENEKFPHVFVLLTEYAETVKFSKFLVIILH